MLPTIPIHLCISTLFQVKPFPQFAVFTLRLIFLFVYFPNQNVSVRWAGTLPILFTILSPASCMVPSWQVGKNIWWLSECVFFFLLERNRKGVFNEVWERADMTEGKVHRSPSSQTKGHISQQVGFKSNEKGVKWGHIDFEKQKGFGVTRESKRGLGWWMLHTWR